MFVAWSWILSLDVYDPVALSLPFIIDPIADNHWFSSRLLLWVRQSSLFSKTGCCFVWTFFHHRFPVFLWLWSLGHLFDVINYYSDLSTRCSKGCERCIRCSTGCEKWMYEVEQSGSAAFCLSYNYFNSRWALSNITSRYRYLLLISEIFSSKSLFFPFIAFTCYL